MQYADYFFCLLFQFPVLGQSLGSRLTFSFEEEADLAVDMDILDLTERNIEILKRARKNKELPPISKKYRSHRFLNTVGGVSFDQTAIPVDDLEITA